MNYKLYESCVFTQEDLDYFVKKFYEDIEKQKQQILEFEKCARDRIALIDNWEKQKNFIILGRTFKYGKEKCISFIKRYPDQSQIEKRYNFNKIADMRKKMIELEEKYSGADWSRFKKEIE